MKTLIALSALFVTTTASAHIEPGTWMGKTAQGAECGFVAGPAYFEPNVQHPLNERIKVQIGTDVFVMQHPPVVDAATSTAFFNHDLFQGVLATSTGARALIIQMVHETGKEGPTAFQLIDHAWKTNSRKSVICRGLTFTGRR
jgi:hypothetical protein